MAVFLPSELLTQILIRLPVKSLIQCRSVSKAWKSLIDSSDFIADHSLLHTQPEHLLIRYKNPYRSWPVHYISIVDDDTFPLQKSVRSVPPVVNVLNNLRTVGSSHGLLCFYGGYIDSGPNPHYKLRKDMAVLWNPSIRKSILIFVPKVLYNKSYTAVVGFGVCPVNRDPKIVKITFSCQNKRKPFKPWKVEVYSLSMGEWRSLSSNLPQQSIEVTWSHVAIDRFIYWFAFDRILIDGQFRSTNLILSFNMSNESFGLIDLPDCLLLQPVSLLSVSKLRDSLTVLEHRVENMKKVCDVWMMDHGSFTKLYTIEAPQASIRTTLGFRKSGEPIIETKGHYGRPAVPTALGVYEPTSKHINDLGIYVQNDFIVNPYVETLLLLNR